MRDSRLILIKKMFKIFYKRGCACIRVDFLQNGDMVGDCAGGRGLGVTCIKFLYPLLFLSPSPDKSMLIWPVTMA